MIISQGSIIESPTGHASWTYSRCRHTGPYTRKAQEFGLMLCYCPPDFFEVVFCKWSSMEQCSIACHVCLLSSPVSPFAYSVHDVPWAQDSGGVPGSSVRCKVNIIRKIYLNKISSQPRKSLHRGRRGEKTQFLIEISIQPECNPHHRQSTEEMADRKKSHPLFIAKKRQPITYMFSRYKKKKKHREAEEEEGEEEGAGMSLWAILDQTGPKNEVKITETRNNMREESQNLLTDWL